MSMLENGNPPLPGKEHPGPTSLPSALRVLNHLGPGSQAQVGSGIFHRPAARCSGAIMANHLRKRSKTSEEMDTFTQAISCFGFTKRPKKPFASFMGATWIYDRHS